MKRPRRLPLFVVASFGLTFAVAAPASAQLLDAVKAGDQATVSALIEGGSDVNAAEPDGTTPLHWAAY